MTRDEGKTRTSTAATSPELPSTTRIYFSVKRRVTPRQSPPCLPPILPRANRRKESLHTPLRTKFPPSPSARDARAECSSFRVTANCYDRYNDSVLIYIIIYGASQQAIPRALVEAQN